MKKLLLLSLFVGTLFTLHADTPIITGCGVFDLGSRAVSMQWVTDEPGSLTKSRVDYDFLSSITSGTAPATLDYKTHARGTNLTSASVTRRGARVHKLYPGVKTYVNCMSRDASSNWSLPFVCTRTCTNCGPNVSDSNYFMTGSQLNCDAIGQPPYFTTPADSATPAPPEPPIHTGLTEPPTITGPSSTIAAGCTDLQNLINTRAAHAKANTLVEEILIPPNEICRPEQESSGGGSNLSQYTLPDARPGKVVIRSSANSKLCPAVGVRTDPSLYDACTAKFGYNKNDLRDLKVELFYFAAGANLGGYYFENPSIRPPPLDEISKLTMTVTAVNTTTDVITVNSTTGLEDGDIVVVNLAADGVLSADGPARACHVNVNGANTLKLERARSNFCNQTDVNLLGTYDGSGGTIARWIAQPVAAWQNTTPLRATVTGHGMGNYPADPITAGSGNTLTVSGATGTGYLIAAGNAVWISGTDSATCDGLRLVSSFVGTLLTLSTAGTNCSPVTTGTVQRIIGLSTFNTSDPDLGTYDPKVFYFRVIDANTLEFPELGTQGTVSTPGYIALETPVIPAIVGRPDEGSGRKQDLTFDRALVEFPFPYRVHEFLGMTNTTSLQLVNSWVDIRLWQRLNKLNKSGCTSTACIDGVTDAGTTGIAYVSYFQGAQDHQYVNTTVVGSSDWFLDGGAVTTPSFDISFRQITQFRTDARASYHTNSDGHLYRETYCIEMKTGYRVSFYGNYHRGCRVDFSKNGATIEFSDVAPGSPSTNMMRVSDIDIRYITIADSAGGIYFPAADDHQEVIMGIKQRFRFNNILLANLDYQTYKDPQWLGDSTTGGFGFGFLGGITHLDLSNVTYFQKRAGQPFPIYFGEQGGSAVQIHDNIWGVTEGSNTGFPATNDGASGGNAVPAADFSGAQASFDSIYLKGPNTDPDSSFTNNFYLPLIESSTAAGFAAKFVDTATSNTLCRHEAAALTPMAWDDVSTNVVGTTDNPCLESAATRTISIFGATGWQPQGSYTAVGASPSAMIDPQGWITSPLITENSPTSITISWHSPNTSGCTVDITHSTLDFSNASNITRQTDAGGTQDQSETFTGLSQVTPYRARIGCKNAEPMLPLKPFTTGGVN